MAVDLSPIDESLLATIANIHGMPKGAFNIRRDGQLVERHNSAYVEISTKTDNPGIDIKVKPGTKGESVFIPVIVTQSGLKDVVYNTFYIGDDCDIDIIAGCGIHNDSHAASEHDGIHSFHIGNNCRIKYIEKHYGEGEGTGERILNPTTNVFMGENSFCEMEMVQLKGVSSTVRDTNAKIGAGSKLVLTERLLTHGDQTADECEQLRLPGVHVQQDRQRRTHARAVRDTQQVRRDKRILEHALVRCARQCQRCTYEERGAHTGQADVHDDVVVVGSPRWIRVCEWRGQNRKRGLQIDGVATDA